MITSTVTVVVCVTPPPVPVTVMVRVPSAVFEVVLIVIVEVPDPGAAIGLGLKLTVSRLPCPDADKLIAELKPPEPAVVIVAVPELRLTMVTDVGDALMVKFGATPVTVSETVVVSVVVPEVPATVMG